MPSPVGSVGGRLAKACYKPSCSDHCRGLQQVYGVDSKMDLNPEFYLMRSQMPRKFSLGRGRKNEERRRQKEHQTQGTNKMGRPSKKVCTVISFFFRCKIIFVRRKYTKIFYTKIMLQRKFSPRIFRTSTYTAKTKRLL